MANEVTTSVSVGYDDEVRSGLLDVASRIATSAGKQFLRSSQNIPTGGAALNLGSLGSVGTILIVNADDTNFVTVYDAVSSKAFAILEKDTDADGKGGWCGMSKGGGDFQAPYLVADTDTVKVEYLVIEQ